MSKMYGKGKSAIESEEQQKLRFQVELEFVQCLANPNYLNFLAQRGYFKDPAFINYLKYLQYWKEPEYAKYIMYPMCLYFLDLLQYEHFRREIVNSQCCKFIDDQAILQWQHYTRKRIKMFDMVQNMKPQQANAGAITGAAGATQNSEGAIASGGAMLEAQLPQQQAQQGVSLTNGIGSGQQQQQQIMNGLGGGGVMGK